MKMGNVGICFELRYHRILRLSGRYTKTSLELPVLIICCECFVEGGSGYPSWPPNVDLPGPAPRFRDCGERVHLEGAYASEMASYGGSMANERGEIGYI